MPEYDAFGREIASDAPAPTPVEPAVAEPEPVAPQRLEFVRPPRRRRRGGVASLLVLVAIVAGVGLVGNADVDTGGGLIERVQPADPELPPAGLQRDSLIQREHLAAALRTMSDAGLGRPASIRVAPDRIDATLVKRGRFHQVQITPGGDLRELGTGSAPPRPAVAYAAIDPAAPERLTRAGATRRQPARSINYVLLMPGRPVTWGAYYKRGRIVIGDAHGRLQRVL